MDAAALPLSSLQAAAGNGVLRLLLLLLAAALLGAARSLAGRGAAQGWGLTLAAAGVLASAPAWSGLSAPAQSAVAQALALSWSMGAVLAARWLWAGRWLTGAAALALALLCAYTWLVVAWPPVFGALVSGQRWVLASALLIATAGAVVALAQIDNQRLGLALRIGGGLVCALVLTLPDLLPAAPANPVIGTGWGSPTLLLVALLLACALLLSSHGAPADAGSGPTRMLQRQVTTLDSLTQLPTRVFFETKLAALARNCKAKDKRMALFFIDLDGFKPVNDTFGHQCGDQVLEQVGKRLRKLAGRQGLGARIGGDEFLMLLTSAGNEVAVAMAAKRLISVISEPYSVEGREVTISASVGIAMYPDGCSHTALITRADAAMYAAKRAGGSRHCFYTSEMDADSRAGFELLADLRQAITRQELELHYQPKIDARSGQVTAAEALLRWKHPTRGLLMPGSFIELAERFGMISAIGDWVIADACRQAREWREKGLRMRVAINLSAHQMREDDLADRIALALQQHRIHPSLLTCEITETAAMEDTRTTQQTFRRLGELGVHLSIDDFGTGYSSLAYLRKLPAGELKIDRSFVMDIEHSRDARAVIDAVLKLAHALGLRVVAEGVENQRQQQVLVELGCDELQGYLFARPMSARALLLWALRDKQAQARFRPSLFGQTQEAPEHMRPTPRPSAAGGQRRSNTAAMP